MMSLDNAMSAEELAAWGQRVARGLPDETVQYVCELKIDGARDEHPLRGRSLRAGGDARRRTGGRGRHGQRRHDRRRPRDAGAARRAAVPDVLEVRGEVYLPVASFERMNEEAAAAGEPAVRQPPQRRRRQPAPEGRRRSPPSATCRSGCTSSARSSGGPPLDAAHREPRLPAVARVPGQPRDRRCSSRSTTSPRHCKHWEAAPPRPRLRDRRRRREDRRRRPAGPARDRRRGRRGGRSPTSSRPRSARRCCDDIQVSIGRTGRATPFAVLEPVFVGGSTVGMATLHNEDQVRGQGRAARRHGDRAQGRRRHPRGRRPGAVDAAGRQPSRGCSRRRARARCGSTLVRLEGEADTRCVEPACPFQRDQRIIYFASRGAMDIEGLGERTVGQLTATGLVADAADLYGLTQEQLLTLEGFATISADKLLAAIDGSRHRPLPRLLTALGIKHLGPAASQALAADVRHARRGDGGARRVELAAVEGARARSSPRRSRSWFALRVQPGVRRAAAGGRCRLRRAHRRGGEQLPQMLAGKAVVVSAARWTASPGRRPRRRSSPVAARARAASARRRSPSSSATSPGASKVTKAETGRRARSSTRTAFVRAARDRRAAVDHVGVPRERHPADQR